MTVAELLGFSVLTTWGATPSALILAAGLLLLLASLKQALAAPQPPGPAPQQAPVEPSVAIALPPLAFSMIVTPPGIGVLVIFTACFRDTALHVMILGIGLAVIVLDLLAMLASRTVVAWVGPLPLPLRILGAVFGVLQVALAIEFIVNGLARSPLLPR